MFGGCYRALKFRKTMKAETGMLVNLSYTVTP